MKKCSGCHEEKLLECFAPHRIRGTQSWCRDCNKARSKQYYADNRDKHIAVVHQHKVSQRKRNQENYCNYLLSHPCVDCGEADILVLEADHLRDKKKNVSLLLNAYAWAAVVAELEKCDIVCSNCHARRTQQRIGSYRIKFMESLGV